LEVTGSRLERIIPAARRVQAQDGGRGAGRGRRRDRNRGFSKLAYLEEEIEERAEEVESEVAMKPPMIRNPLFRGEAGKEMLKELLKDRAIEDRKFTIDKNLAWSFIIKHLDATINDKINLLPMFDINYAKHNVFMR
jgi:hypothetical protein